MFDRIHLWSYLVWGSLLALGSKPKFRYQCFWLFYSYFLFLPNLIFARLYLRICLLLLGCPVYWHNVVWFLWSFIFLYSLELFISAFIDVSPLLFSWWVWLKLYQFYLLTEAAFSFIDILYYFFVSISFFSVLSLWFLFSNFGFWFFVLFLVALGITLGLIWNFSCFL